MDLAGLALEMAKPEFSLLSQGLGVRPTVTTDGDHTIHTFVTDHLGDMNLGRDLEVAVTTGAQGQILDAVIRDLPSQVKASSTSGATMTLSMHMVSYNQPVSIAAPRKSDVKPMTSKTLNGLSGGNPLLKDLLGGGSLSALGGATLQ
jgi:hypothetical protein